MLGAQRCIDQSASPRQPHREPLPRQGSFSWYLFKADHIIYPANFPGLGEALIFFCCFSSIKGRKAGRETPRNSRLQPIAKKQHAQIPDYRPIASKRQAFLHRAAYIPKRETQKKGSPSAMHDRRGASVSTLNPLPSTLNPLLSTLYPLPSTPSTHKSLLPNDSGSSASADSTQQYSVRPQR